jgi:ribonuclease J
VYAFGGRVVPPSVIKDRIAIAQDGIAMVVVPLDASGAVAGGVTITTRGVAGDEGRDALLATAARSAEEALRDVPRPRGVAPDEAALAEAARLAVRRALSRELGFKPVTVVQLVRVAG